MENNIARKNPGKSNELDLSNLDYLAPEIRLNLARLLPLVAEIFGGNIHHHIDPRLHIKMNDLANLISKLPKDHTIKDIHDKIVSQPDVVRVVRGD